MAYFDSSTPNKSYHSLYIAKLLIKGLNTLMFNVINLTSTFLHMHTTISLGIHKLDLLNIYLFSNVIFCVKIDPKLAWNIYRLSLVISMRLIFSLDSGGSK